MRSRLEVLHALDRPEALITEASQQLGEDQQQVEAQFYLLLGLIEARRFQEAEEKARAFQKDLGLSSFFWLLKGYIALASDELKAAEASFLEGLKLDPQDADLLAYLGFVQGFLGDLRASQARFEALLRQDPLHTQGLSFMALVYGEVCHRPDLARQLLHRCLQINPQDATILSLLADFEALPWHKSRLLRQALAFNPFDRDARQSLKRLDSAYPRHAILAGVQLLLAILLHQLPLPTTYWMPVLLGSSCLQAVFLFRHNKHLPGFLLAGLLTFIFFPVQQIDLTRFFIAGGAGALLVLPCYGLHLLLSHFFTAKDKPS
ncbi:hypothetical protein [Marinospirillum perlucidum]|uniref:hypothetical protein n=1 Tax=Marinospirillum perlucidum TaxID=1982602 RepID=UPI000DF1CE59|nr:hypothetical protein [Marinospirillum perlucidum]